MISKMAFETTNILIFSHSFGLSLALSFLSFFLFIKISFCFQQLNGLYIYVYLIAEWMNVRPSFGFDAHFARDYIHRTIQFKHLILQLFSTNDGYRCAFFDCDEQHRLAGMVHFLNLIIYLLEHHYTFHLLATVSFHALHSFDFWVHWLQLAENGQHQFTTN